MRKRLAQKGLEAADRLDLPPILAPDIPRMELYGNRAFYMDRHRGVLGYSTETVDINGGSVVVRITGRNLQLQAMTDEELTDYFAIGQWTPGIIAVNTATFIGQKRKGVWGGIVATLGMVFPSLVIITLLAGLITSFSHLEWVQNAFAGIRVCVCVLILNATVKLWQGAVKDVWGALIFAAVLAGSLLTDLSPVLFVLAAAVAGIIIRCVGGARK